MSKIIFFLIINFSFYIFSMPSLEEIMDEGIENNDITEEQVLLTMMLRCAAGSYFLIGGDQPDKDDLGDWFKDIAFGMGVVVSEQKGTLDKTAGDIREENQKYIDEYFKNYQIDGFNLYKQKGLPNNPKFEDIYSEFFNKDMIYCVEFYEKFGPDEKKD